jgi:branched-chain amino acid aminotransferase
MIESNNLAKSSTEMAEFIWMNGELVPFDQAKVHFLSPTLHYGIGVFEGLRSYNTDRGPAVFRMREHLRRFLNSVRVLGVEDIHHDLETLRDAVCRVIFANNLTECYIRPLLYFEGALGLDLDEYEPVIGIAAWKWDPLLGKDAVNSGVSVMVSSVTRIHPHAGMTKSKFSGQYVNPIMVKTMAKRAGFDEAVMLDPKGFVAGCTGENILLVQDNTVLTPPKSATLEGVTRDTVIKLARDSGYQVSEEPITRDQLYYADEVFVCGTAAEVVGVREIDYRPVGNGKIGPVTRHLQGLYQDTVRGRTRRYLDWLDYLVMEPMI